MTTENLTEFLEGRVLPTRPVHHVQYPVEAREPLVGIWFDSIEDGISVIALPTIAEDLMHLEVHCFVDGERTEPQVAAPGDAVIELTLRRSVPNTSMEV